ncbi:MAG: signal peptidase I [Candidatus Hydrogenedentes bacterium]|nr:signal peptidase I [Candidatus Hydrogenedentota bacterium]
MSQVDTEEEAPPVEAPPPRRLSKTRRAFYIVFIAHASVFIYFFGWVGVRPFQVPSGSMLPTLQPGDFLFAVPVDSYRRGDIVVLRDPLITGGYLVKRIVGTGGDRISVDNGYLSINGEYASEPYIREPIEYLMPPHEVPPGEVLVLGDNRNESDDASRWLINPRTGEAVESRDTTIDTVEGVPWKRTVPVDSIVGKVEYIYLPFSRMGTIKAFPLTNTRGD